MVDVDTACQLAKIPAFHLLTVDTSNARQIFGHNSLLRDVCEALRFRAATYVKRCTGGTAVVVAVHFLRNHSTVYNGVVGTLLFLLYSTHSTIVIIMRSVLTTFAICGMLAMG